MPELTARQAVPSAAPRYSRSYSGRAEQAGAVRRFVADALEGSPALGDAVLCASELATNAIVHSKSGLPGGQFEVRVFHHPAGHARVEVTDQGGPWIPDPSGRQNHGRGLLIVSRLAAAWGIVGDDHVGRTAWFELFSAPDAPATAVPRRSSCDE
jgi:anti-sigma regulatory factor (Ser/Thr protein kinase)